MTNQVPVTTLISISGERATMITESKIEHLEDLIERVNKFEKAEPRWNKYKILFTSGITLSFAMFIELLPVWFEGENIYSKLSIISHILFIIGIISTIISRIIINDHYNCNIHPNNIDTIKNILQKLKLQLKQEEK